MEETSQQLEIIEQNINDENDDNLPYDAQIIENNMDDENDDTDPYGDKYSDMDVRNSIQPSRPLIITPIPTENQSDFYTPDTTCTVVTKQNTSWPTEDNCFLHVKTLKPVSTASSVQSVYFTPELGCVPDPFPAITEDSGATSSQDHLCSIVSDSQEESVDLPKDIIHISKKQDGTTSIQCLGKEENSEIFSPVIQYIERKSDPPVLSMNAIQPDGIIDENTVNDSSFHQTNQHDGSAFAVQIDGKTPDVDLYSKSSVGEKNGASFPALGSHLKQLSQKVSMDCSAHELCQFDSSARETTVDNSEIIREEIDALIDALSSPQVTHPQKHNLGIPMCTSSPFQMSTNVSQLELDKKLLHSTKPLGNHGVAHDEHKVDETVSDEERSNLQEVHSPFQMSTNNVSQLELDKECMQSTKQILGDHRVCQDAHDEHNKVDETVSDEERGKLMQEGCVAAEKCLDVFEESSVQSAGFHGATDRCLDVSGRESAGHHGATSQCLDVSGRESAGHHGATSQCLDVIEESGCHGATQQNQSQGQVMFNIVNFSTDNNDENQLHADNTEREGRYFTKLNEENNGAPLTHIKIENIADKTEVVNDSVLSVIKTEDYQTIAVELNNDSELNIVCEDQGIKREEDTGGSDSADTETIQLVHYSPGTHEWSIENGSNYKKENVIDEENSGCGMTFSVVRQMVVNDAEMAKTDARESLLEESVNMGNPTAEHKGALIGHIIQKGNCETSELAMDWHTCAVEGSKAISHSSSNGSDDNTSSMESTDELEGNDIASEPDVNGSYKSSPFDEAQTHEQESSAADDSLIWSQMECAEDLLASPPYDTEISFGPAYLCGLLLDAVPVDSWRGSRCARAAQVINYFIAEATEKYHFLNTSSDEEHKKVVPDRTLSDSTRLDSTLSDSSVENKKTNKNKKKRNKKKANRQLTLGEFLTTPNQEATIKPNKTVHFTALSRNDSKKKTNVHVTFEDICMTLE